MAKMTKEEFMRRYRIEQERKAINEKYNKRREEKINSINIADRYKIESIKKKRGY